MDQTSPVSHYGLHGDGDLFFLLEQRRSACVTPGLSGLPSPVRVERPDRLTCPHALLPMEPAIEVPTDNELILKLAPLPDGGCYHLPPAGKVALRSLLPMSRPTRPIAFVPWAHPIARLVGELNLTNLSPLVIADYQPRDIRDLTRLLDLPRIRTVILCGELKAPGSVSIDWGHLLPDLPWDQVGTSLLQKKIARAVVEARS